VRIESDNKILSAKLSTIEDRSHVVENHASAPPAPARSPTKRLQVTPVAVRRLAGDLLTYLGVIQTNRPQLILSSTSTALTERSLAAGDQYENNAVRTFFQRFSGPIYRVEQALGAKGSIHLESRLTFPA